MYVVCHWFISGGEFNANVNLKVYKKYGIHYYTTFDLGSKVGIVERAIRSIKERLFKILASQDSWRWTDDLGVILDVYNRTYNRVLKMTPNQAAKEENEPEVFYNTVTKPEMKNLERNLQFRFEVGDTVRIQRSQMYQKAYTGNFSDIIYVIYRRSRISGIPVYYLRELLTGEEILGSFYGPELQAVKVDMKKVADIEKIYATRLTPDNEEEVKVRLRGDKKTQWVKYKTLLGY